MSRVGWKVAIWDGRETRFQGVSPGTGQSRWKNQAVLVPWKKLYFFLS